MNRRLYLGIGFGVWLLATIVFRVAGHLFFLAENTAVMVALYLIAGAGMVGLALGIFRWQRLSAGQRFQAAILLILPGQLLDVLAVQFFASVYPNMPTVANAPFGAWLLWVYATVLVAAFLPDWGKSQE